MQVGFEIMSTGEEVTWQEVSRLGATILGSIPAIVTTVPAAPVLGVSVIVNVALALGASQRIMMTNNTAAMILVNRGRIILRQLGRKYATLGQQ